MVDDAIWRFFIRPSVCASLPNALAILSHPQKRPLGRTVLLQGLPPRAYKPSWVGGRECESQLGNEAVAVPCISR